MEWEKLFSNEQVVKKFNYQGMECVIRRVPSKTYHFEKIIPTFFYAAYIALPRDSFIGKGQYLRELKGHQGVTYLRILENHLIIGYDWDHAFDKHMGHTPESVEKDIKESVDELVKIVSFKSKAEEFIKEIELVCQKHGLQLRTEDYTRIDIAEDRFLIGTLQDKYE